VQRGGLKLYIGPLQLTKLAGAKTMSEADKDRCAVALRVSIFLGGLNQFFDYTIGQMFAWSEFVVGKPPRGLPSVLRLLE
jgi:hypothetical protein